MCKKIYKCHKLHLCFKSCISYTEPLLPVYITPLLERSLEDLTAKDLGYLILGPGHICAVC